MRSDKYLWKVCEKMYKEMYAESEPSADWDELVESGEAMQENFYRNYFLPRDQYEEIYDRICHEHKITKRERAKIGWTVHLGSSPSSVRPFEWDKEEN